MKFYHCCQSKLIPKKQPNTIVWISFPVVFVGACGYGSQIPFPLILHLCENSWRDIPSLFPPCLTVLQGEAVFSWIRPLGIGTEHVQPQLSLTLFFLFVILAACRKHEHLDALSICLGMWGLSLWGALPLSLSLSLSLSPSLSLSLSLSDGSGGVGVYFSHSIWVHKSWSPVLLTYWILVKQKSTFSPTTLLHSVPADFCRGICQY